MCHPFRRAALALLAALCFGLAASAADAKPAPAPAAPASTVGVLQMGEVMRGYKGWARAQELLGTFYAENLGLLDELEEKGMGLTREEFEIYERLAGHKVKIDPEKIKELEGKARAAQEEYSTLRAKAEPTEADRARLQELNTRFQTVAALLNEKRAPHERAYYDVEGRYVKALLAEIDGAIATVAAAKKLTMVVNRDVQVPDLQSQRMRLERFVIWGGADITADVVKTLNDNFKDTVLEPAKPEAKPATPAPK